MNIGKTQDTLIQKYINYRSAFKVFPLVFFVKIRTSVNRTPVGGWEKANYRWPLKEIYQTIKSREPECQVGINWSIGLPENPDYHLVEPKDQKEGYPIRYFPSDFRLGDPFLPAETDPKIFTDNGKEYYMPWESTVCISGK